MYIKNHDIKIVLIDWQAFFTSFIVGKVVRMCNFNDLALDTYLGYNIIEINRGICNKSHLILKWIFSYFVLSSIVSCIFRFYLALCSNMCSSSTFDVYSKYEQCQQKNEKCHYNAMSQKFYFSKYSLVILFMNSNRNPSPLRR